MIAVLTIPKVRSMGDVCMKAEVMCWAEWNIRELLKARTLQARGPLETVKRMRKMSGECGATKSR